MLNKGIFSDLRAAGQVFGRLRNARWNGHGVHIGVSETLSIPVYEMSLRGGTMESTLLKEELNAAVRKVFYTFDREQQHALTFAPEDGGWVDRAVFWRETLKPALPPAQYYAAMERLLSWYISCVKRRKAVQQ